MNRRILLLTILLARAAHAQLTCNGRFEMSYPGIGPFTDIGDIVTLRASYGAGPILGGSTLFVNNFAVELACDSSFPVIPCVAEPGKIKYLGDAQTTTNCNTCINIATQNPAPCAFTSNSPAGGTVPNDVIFQLPPNVFLQVPELAPVPFCSVDLKIQKLAESTDATPNFIEENAGFVPSAIPNCPGCLAVCDNFVLASQITQSSALIGAPSNEAFQCYEAPRRDTHKPNVTITVTDQFGSDSVVAQRLHDFCAPADLNGLDPGAPQNPLHLGGYVLGDVDAGSFSTPTVTATTVFGTFSLKVGTPVVLFVPTAKSIVPAPPPAPLVVPTNHYLCHRAVNATPGVRGTPVTETDQFSGPYKNRLSTVNWLCAPAQKNNFPVIDPAAFLVCFGTNPPSAPAGPGNAGVVANLDNQFGQPKVDVTQALGLCVAATVP